MFFANLKDPESQDLDIENRHKADLEKPYIQTCPTSQPASSNKSRMSRDYSITHLTQMAMPDVVMSRAHCSGFGAWKPASIFIRPNSKPNDAFPQSVRALPLPLSLAIGSHRWSVESLIAAHSMILDSNHHTRHNLNDIDDAKTKAHDYDDSTDSIPYLQRAQHSKTVSQDGMCMPMPCPTTAVSSRAMWNALLNSAWPIRTAFKLLSHYPLTESPLKRQYSKPQVDITSLPKCAHRNNISANWMTESQDQLSIPPISSYTLDKKHLSTSFKMTSQDDSMVGICFTFMTSKPIYGAYFASLPSTPFASPLKSARWPWASLCSASVIRRKMFFQRLFKYLRSTYRQWPTHIKGAATPAIVEFVLHLLISGPAEDPAYLSAWVPPHPAASHCPLSYAQSLVAADKEINGKKYSYWLRSNAFDIVRCHRLRMLNSALSHFFLDDQHLCEHLSAEHYSQPLQASSRQLASSNVLLGPSFLRSPKYADSDLISDLNSDQWASKKVPGALGLIEPDALVSSILSPFSLSANDQKGISARHTEKGSKYVKEMDMDPLRDQVALTHRMKRLKVCRRLYDIQPPLPDFSLPVERGIWRFTKLLSFFTARRRDTDASNQDQTIEHTSYDDDDDENPDTDGLKESLVNRLIAVQSTETMTRLRLMKIISLEDFDLKNVSDFPDMHNPSRWANPTSKPYSDNYLKFLLNHIKDTKMCQALILTYRSFLSPRVVFLELIQLYTWLTFREFDEEYKRNTIQSEEMKSDTPDKTQADSSARGNRPTRQESRRPSAQREAAYLKRHFLNQSKQNLPRLDPSTDKYVSQPLPIRRSATTKPKRYNASDVMYKQHRDNSSEDISIGRNMYAVYMSSSRSPSRDNYGPEVQADSVVTQFTSNTRHRGSMPPPRLNSFTKNLLSPSSSEIRHFLRIDAWYRDKHPDLVRCPLEGRVSVCNFLKTWVRLQHSDFWLDVVLEVMLSLFTRSVIQANIFPDARMMLVVSRALEETYLQTLHNPCHLNPSDEMTRHFCANDPFKISRRPTFLSSYDLNVCKYLRKNVAQHDEFIARYHRSRAGGGEASWSIPNYQEGNSFPWMVSSFSASRMNSESNPLSITISTQEDIDSASSLAPVSNFINIQRTSGTKKKSSASFDSPHSTGQSPSDSSIQSLQISKASSRRRLKFFGRLESSSFDTLTDQQRQYIKDSVSQNESSDMSNYGSETAPISTALLSLTHGNFSGTGSLRWPSSRPSSDIHRQSWGSAGYTMSNPLTSRLISEIRSYIPNTDLSTELGHHLVNFSEMSPYPIPMISCDHYRSLLNEVPPLGEILKISPIEVARQQTLLDHLLLTRNPIHCFVEYGRDCRSDALAPFFDNYNNMILWVGELILSRPDRASRVATVQFLIKMTRELLLMQNYYAFSAFISGLTQSYIERLKDTWKKVDRKVKRHLTDLISIATPSNNFAVLRSLCATASPPFIPPPVVFLKDLIFCFIDNDTFAHTKAEQQSVTTATTATSPAPLIATIDPEKMEVLGKVLTPLHKARRSNYNFWPLPGVQHLLTRAGKHGSYEALESLSHRVEPDPASG